MIKENVLLSHYIFGKPSKKNVIDHINRHRLDNRALNLREATKKQNGQNKEKQSNTSSQYIGVRKKENKWEASCNSQYLGSFKTELEAAKIYDKFAFIVYGKHASTNNLVSYESVTNLKVEEILKNINKQANKKFNKIKIVTEAILRNEDGIAIINIYNKNKEFVCSTLVDDDKWHYLMQFNWNLSNDYIS